MYINKYHGKLSSSTRLGEACKRTKWAFFKLRKQMRTQRQ